MDRLAKSRTRYYNQPMKGKKEEYKKDAGHNYLLHRSKRQEKA
jgi:hypothetical protein